MNIWLIHPTFGEAMFHPSEVAAAKECGWQDKNGKPPLPLPIPAPAVAKAPLAKAKGKR